MYNIHVSENSAVKLSSLGLAHSHRNKSCNHLENGPDLRKGQWEWSHSKYRASSQGEAKRELATLQSEV